MIAKLTRPKTDGAVARERLFRRLDEAFTHTPLVWISSPGGAGKTVLVSSYLRERGLNCLWFRMDAQDCEPSNFFHYLGQAVAAAAPRHRKPMPLLTAEYLHSEPIFSQRYFEEVGRRLKESVVVVFDNCEAVPDDAYLWSLLAQGVGCLPPGVKLIFTSRHEIPGAFASLQINGRLGAVGWEEMKVSPAEAELIGAQHGQVIAEVRRLHERSDGWMAALVLMLEQRRRGGDDVLADHDSPQALFDFFSHEIFVRLPQEVRTLLLKTAFLPTVSVAAAERLSGEVRAGRILSDLCRHNLFTERLSGGGAVYRYHPLFRNFLVQQCPAVFSAAEMRDIKYVSATVLSESGALDAAAPLLVEVGAFVSALELLLANASTFINQGRNQTLLDLLASLPGELINGSSFANFWRGIALQPFDPAAARDHFSRAFDLFREAGDLPGMLRCWSALVETVFHAWDNFTQIDPWIAWLDNIAHEPLIIADPTLDLQVSSTMTAALTMRGGDPRSMRAWAGRAIRALASVEDVPPRLSALIYCTNYLAWVQPLELDTTAIDISLRDAERAELPPILRLATLYVRAALELHRAPDMSVLLEEVRSALALADQTGVHVWDEILCGLGVHCAVLLQERSASAFFLERMRQCVCAERKQGLAFYYYVRAWDRLVFGATGEAREDIRQALHLYGQTGYEFPSNVAYYGAAIICAEHGELDTALAYAVQADSTAKKFQAFAMRHSTLLTLAYVHHKRGECMAAAEALREAFRIGKAGGYYLTLWWWYAPMMSTLADLALREGIECDHVIEVVRRLKLTPVDPGAAPAAWPWPIRIDTLGPFEVNLDGQPLDSGKKPGQKPLALLKLLAASGADGLSVSVVADLLWPGSEGDKAHHALEMALHRARKMVGSDEAILIRNGWIRLNPSLCWVDSHAFTAGVEAGLRAMQQGRPEEGRRALERALDLYRGHLLAGDRYVNQVAPTRERLWRRYLVALEKLRVLYESAGQIEMALDRYRHACELDELAEEPCRQYMRYCLQLGRRDEARRAYAQLDRAMQQTLGVAPAEATRALFDPVA